MSPKYLSDIIPSTTRRYSLRNASNIPLVRASTNYFMIVTICKTFRKQCVYLS